MVKVSVIVPVYKVENYLRQCVDSILNQTYRNIEVILVDDGSPDDCPKICDEYAKVDDRVIIIHKENGGLSDARNKGVECATGEFGLFVDGDDFWDCLEGLKELVDRQAENPSEVLCFGYYKQDEDTGKKTVKAYHSESMPKSIRKPEEQMGFLMNRGLYIASACNKMVAMSLLKKMQFAKGKVAEDIVWCALLLREAKSFDYINLSFYCYRQRRGSITNSISEKSCIDLKDAIIACYGLMEQADTLMSRLIGQYTAYQFSTFIAVQALSTGFPKQDISDLKAYAKVLKHSQSSRKVRIMYFGTQLMGLMHWCRFIRATRFFWNSRRDIV